MINRALIRLKVVQLVYAYCQTKGKTKNQALAELGFSLDKSYDLYHSLLLLLVELRRMAEGREERRAARAQLRIEKAASTSNDGIFANNQFLLQLANNLALQQWIKGQETIVQKHYDLLLLQGDLGDKKKMLSTLLHAQQGMWDSDSVPLRKLYDELINHEVFLAYVDLGDRSYEADREVVRKLYKTLIVNNEAFDSLLEEHSLYWNDDKEIIDSFVLKTIKRFAPSQGAAQELLPQYATEEDRDFAARLFSATIDRKDEWRDLISKNSKNWEFSRLALMDVILLQIALAEILSFESIPVQVSFNEYLDIAKVYSTPRSASYINGMLDNIVRQLAAEGQLLKPLPLRKPRPQQEGAPQRQRRNGSASSIETR